MTRTTRPLTHEGVEFSREPGWPLQLCWSFLGQVPYPTVILLMLAVGADDDAPFSLRPRVHALARDVPSKPMIGGQVWFAWCGLVAGFRVDVLPPSATLDGGQP